MGNKKTRVLSLKISDTEWKAVEAAKGAATTSEYLRAALNDKLAGDRRDSAELTKLLSDIDMSIRQIRDAQIRSASGDIRIIRAGVMSIVATSPAAEAKLKEKFPEFFLARK